MEPETIDRRHNLIVQDNFVFWTKIEFQTQFDLEVCREKLSAIHAVIPTGVGGYDTQIYGISINRHLNKKGEGYYLTFKLDASLNPLFSGWRGYIMSLYGQINYYDNNTTSVTGEIKVSENFTLRVIVFSIVLVVLPAILALWFLLSTGDFLTAFWIVVFLLFGLVILYIHLRPIMNCKKQLINMLYKALVA